MSRRQEQWLKGRRREDHREKGKKTAENSKMEVNCSKVYSLAGILAGFHKTKTFHKMLYNFLCAVVF